MLKTNAKKARENVRAYIIANYETEDETAPADDAEFREIAGYILETFRDQVFDTPNQRRWFHDSEIEAFYFWCQGLPGVLDTCYYYNRSAITDLGDILEETEEERNKYSESQAEAELTRLIYRELMEATR